ncbi:hypothetical protein CDA63_13205 [Hymenobacter amundsenii]|uniref:YcxB-like C-terminal domain-containing protein n=1 Tax=Hymenobacter amundsenii TaxID=2006685 RepID=A0A246FJ43_9BACT|nr:YcxB family protein [Hymenobacter amundsenii]OWP62594.1 hypothetical protein CDA63_13205 [Hymenobacter amundsenii]
MTPIEITVKFSEDYYEAIFTDWLRYRSKNRKWQKLAGAILLLIGFTNTLVIWLFGSSWYAVSIITILFGGLQFWDFYQTKRQWLRDRKSSNVTGEDVRMSFTAEGFQHAGPFSTGDYKWTGIQKVQEARQGLFLLSGNGFSIYLPKNSFQSDQDFETVKLYAQQHLINSPNG